MKFLRGTFKEYLDVVNISPNEKRLNFEENLKNNVDNKYFWWGLLIIYCKKTDMVLYEMFKILSEYENRYISYSRYFWNTHC